MSQIRYATKDDMTFWFRLDKHLTQEAFLNKVRGRMAYILEEGDIPTGLLRYQLFWDNLPFCTMLYIEAEHRGMGYGSRLMTHWEKEMKMQGHKMVMTSTRADETAQHFYRKLGYQDAGGLLLPIPPYEQPLEIFFIKPI